MFTVESIILRHITNLKEIILLNLNLCDIIKTKWGFSIQESGFQDIKKAHLTFLSQDESTQRMAKKPSQQDDWGSTKSLTAQLN